MVQIRPDRPPRTSTGRAEDGPAAEVRRIARASTANDGATTLNEQAVLQLKNRGLRDADLWLGDGGFALRHGDILDLAVHPESRRQGVGTALAAAALPAGPQGRGVVARRPPRRRPGSPSASGFRASASWRSCGGRCSTTWSR